MVPRTGAYKWVEGDDLVYSITSTERLGWEMVEGPPENCWRRNSWQELHEGSDTLDASAR